MWFEPSHQNHTFHLTLVITLMKVWFNLPPSKSHFPHHTLSHLWKCDSTYHHPNHTFHITHYHTYESVIQPTTIQITLSTSHIITLRKVWFNLPPSKSHFPHHTLSHLGKCDSTYHHPNHTFHITHYHTYESVIQPTTIQITLSTSHIITLMKVWFNLPPSKSHFPHHTLSHLGKCDSTYHHPNHTFHITHYHT